jgi:hypothetical protein
MDRRRRLVEPMCYAGRMSEAPKTPTQTMAELVARKAALQGKGAHQGGRRSERAAAALSASKSKPALGR